MEIAVFGCPWGVPVQDSIRKLSPEHGDAFFAVSLTNIICLLRLLDYYTDTLGDLSESPQNSKANRAPKVVISWYKALLPKLQVSAA